MHFLCPSHNIPICTTLSKLPPSHPISSNTQSMEKFKTEKNLLCNNVLCNMASPHPKFYSEAVWTIPKALFRSVSLILRILKIPPKTVSHLLRQCTAASIVSAVRRIGNNAIRSRLGGKRQGNTVLHLLLEQMVFYFVTVQCILHMTQESSCVVPFFLYLTMLNMVALHVFHWAQWS